MKRLVTITLLALSLGLANAQTAVSGSAANSTSNSLSGAYTGSSSATAGSSYAGATNAGNDNAQNIIFNTPAAPTTVNVRSVPSVMAPIIGITANCVVGISAGGAAMGWGFSVGGGVTDSGCVLRENSRLLHNLGQTDIALKLLCNDEQVAKVLPICKVEAEAAPK